MPVYELQTPDGKTFDVEANSMEEAAQAIAGMGKQQPAIGDGQGLLRQFASGASFGFDDELAGIVSAATGGDYNSARDSYLRESQGYAAENPGKSFAANLAGGLAAGIGGAGKAAATNLGGKAIQAYQGAGALGRLGMNVASGAATGALSGLGNADSGERLAGAGTGALIGGATGAVVQPIAYAAKKATDAIAPPFMWAKDKVLMKPEEQFARKLAQQVERDGMTPGQVAARLGKLGPDAMLADVGENVTGLAEGYAILPGQAKTAAKAAILNRAKGQQDRVAKSVLDGLDLGADDLNFDKQIAGVHSAMREVGKGYAPIVDSVETPMNESMERLLQGPTMKSALGKAFRIAQDDVALGEADSTVQKYLALNDKGEGMFMPFGGQFAEMKQRPTLRVWDYAKRGLDSIINDGTDPITGKLTSQARQAAEFKRKLLSEIDAVAPAYKEVRGKYADQYALESALKLGRAFANKDSEVTLRFLEEMSDPEKAMFRAGAARAIRDKVFSAPETGEAYKRVFGSKLMKERIRSIFPDAKSYAKFARDIEREAVFGQTKNTILGNSRTAAREALKDDAGIDPSVLMDFAQGRVGALASKFASNRLQSAMEVPEAVRNVGAQYLFSTDPATKAKALQLLNQQAGILGQRRLIAPPSQYVPLTAGLLGMQAGQ